MAIDEVVIGMGDDIDEGVADPGYIKIDGGIRPGAPRHDPQR